MEAGKILKRYRQNLGLNQVAVSERLGLHRTSISKIESDRQEVTINQLKKLCKLYKISLVQFVSHYEEGEILPRLMPPHKRGPLDERIKKLEMRKARLLEKIEALSKEARDE